MLDFNVLDSSLDFKLYAPKQFAHGVLVTNSERLIPPPPSRTRPAPLEKMANTESTNFTNVHKNFYETIKSDARSVLSHSQANRFYFQNTLRSSPTTRSPKLLKKLNPLEVNMMKLGDSHFKIALTTPKCTEIINRNQRVSAVGWVGRLTRGGVDYDRVEQERDIGSG